MTISINIGKVKVSLKYTALLGYRKREVELDVQWHSCGTYQVSYYRPREAKDYRILVEEDWYPPSVDVGFTPEQFDKVFELFPSAVKRERMESYKPFYENYDPDRGMFDFGNDTLFQAFKDPLENEDGVHLVNQYFVRGIPSENTQVLGLSWADFMKLKDLIEREKHEIFYSGVKAVWGE
jgi:hypothetical protein